MIVVSIAKRILSWKSLIKNLLCLVEGKGVIGYAILKMAKSKGF